MFKLLLSLLLVCIVLGVPDSGLNGVVFYRFFPMLLAGSGPLAVTLQLRYIAIQSETRFECLALFHPTAKGKYIRGLVRRPVSEHTVYNKNLCMAYAMYRVGLDLAPQTKALGDSIMASLGLDPSNRTEDLSTPIGLGNYVGRVVIEHRHRDGTNQLGDEGGVKYHRVNYSDYTGFVPANSHAQIVDPDAWQPGITVDTKSRPVSDIYLTPQLEFLKTLVINANDAEVAPQRDRWDEYPALYRKKVKEVLDTQVALNDYRKIVSEFFDNKIRAFNGMGDYFVEKFSNYSLDFHTVFNFVVNSVIHEATAPVWRLKTVYNAVRPFSAVHYLYKNRRIRGWGGPGRGIVWMDGREWNSWLKTDFFPDYPSGTACLCSAWTEAARLLIDDRSFSYTVHIPKGSSIIEPGFVPAQAFNLTYTSFDTIAEECMLSRVWGGVHFMQAVTEARKLCKPYGRLFYEKVMDMFSGN